jgi:hypothetical protein
LQDPSVVYQLPEPKLAVLESVGGLTVTRTAMVEEWCSFVLTKSNTTTASTSQRKVLKGMALAGSFQVYQLPEPKLAV